MSIQEDGTTSRSSAISRLADVCMGYGAPEIVGFGSSAGFDETYCEKHPDFKICRKEAEPSANAPAACVVNDPTPTELNLRTAPYGRIIGQIVPVSSNARWHELHAKNVGSSKGGTLGKVALHDALYALERQEREFRLWTRDLFESLKEAELRILPLARVDNQPINVRDQDDLIERVQAALQAGEGFTLFTLNLDHLVKRRQSAMFRDLYARASLVTADGWPVVLLARRVEPSIALTTGADMVIPLCQLAARLRKSIYLYGSRTPILHNAAAKLRVLCPGLEVVGCESPPFDFDPAGSAGREAAVRIGVSGAHLCFVALGAPKQEVFADVGQTVAPVTGFVCIGAALDFIAGAQRRAPRVVRILCLEWAWRLAREPRRLGLRYFRCGVLFVRLALRASALF